MATPDASRTHYKRRRTVLKRDYNRQIEEVNRIYKLSCTLENVEQLESIRINMLKTRDSLDETYMGLLECLDPSNDDDKKFEEELLKERDSYFLQLDRAAGLCVAFRRKLEGQTRRESLNAPPTHTAATATAARLPKINVPTFNGDLRKFLDFKALFENLVHNDEDIPPVRKMHYLKESLIEEASKTLANMSISEEGYKEAWGRVLAKYDNKRIIMHTHFNDLFTADRIRTENNLRQLLDKVDVALRGLKACGEQTDRWSSILSYILYVRLDTKTRTDFDNTLTTNATYIAFKDLWKFCESRASNIEARKIEEPVSNYSSPSATPHRPMEPKRTFLASRITCVVCQGQHLLIECTVFAAKSPSERLQLIQAGNLCTNCFSRNHKVQSCTSTKSCKICQQKHHYLLHTNELSTPERSTTNARAASSVALQVQARDRRFIVLPSAKVRFSCGKVVGSVRILLDNCSQATLLSDQLVRRLKLPTFKNIDCAPIRGVGFETVGTPRSCSITLASRLNDYQLQTIADVIPGAAIPYCIKSLQWNDKFQEVSKYNLADTAFYSRNPTILQVDMILGAQYVEACMLNETVQLDQLTLRNTKFGWTLNGTFPTAENNSTPPASHLCCFTTTTIDSQLARFFEIQEEPKQTIEPENFCETHYVQHRTRAANGQFVVRLPFLQSPDLLSATRRKAIAILNRCQANATSELRQGYANFMAEYERLNHMSPVSEPNESDYVIPHHAVLKPDSTTTKIRVVFNASLKSSSGHSLNDLLAIGPQLQPDIFEALIRFRTYPIAITGDIAMMYRCVLIHPDDRRYQKIVWRTSATEPITTYELNTITYGTAPASFLAVRCLLELADTVRDKHPRAAEAISKHFYMDDLMTGASSVQEALDLQRNIQSTLASAGFHLRKYQSNNQEFLEKLPTEIKQPASTDPLGKARDSVILGVAWNCKDDTFKVRAIKSELTSEVHITKRQLLSEVSRVFDPLGLVAPVTVRAKLFVQRVWREEVAWDQRISNELTREAIKYFEELPLLSQFSIPRAYWTEQPNQLRLVGFCDASEQAYCAVIYLLRTHADGTSSAQFVCAKTRIAPIKAITIPRLELQGALLLCNLMDRIRHTLHTPTANIRLYTDSQVVLAWLAKPGHNWSVFVQNRVRSISSVFPSNHWHYTPSESNPADLATRGLRSAELLRTVLWTKGPAFLQAPEGIDASSRFHTQMEEQPITLSTNAATQQPRLIINSFSSYMRMIAVLGRVIHFTRRWKATRPNQVKYDHNSNCMTRARIAAIRLLQVHSFRIEIEALRSNQHIGTDSPLRNLDPFLDEDELLRVKGRLANTDYSSAKKCPIIVPRNSHFMELYVRHIHNTFCHAGKAFILSFVLAEFWVCGGLHAVIKVVLHSCVTCARYRAESYSQVMGQLPSEQATPSRPFSNTGIDFCGPFSCRCVGHRSLKFNKVYACVFVCLSTRAVHIEVVSNLTTTAFLMSLHRFIARRGLPARIRSDCGTNFVSAHNYLDLTDSTIQQDKITHAVQWVFNPPRAPHRGGIWEAAVKSAKSHLCKVIGEQTLNFEEYVTLFSRIEALLNSRPICYRQAPRMGEMILTPSHFLIGSLPYILPEPETSTLPLWKRYDHIRVLLQSFWRLWKADYLNLLQKKEKWVEGAPNIRTGQVVLLKTASAPSTWPFGVIETVLPDQLGVVRTVTVRTANGATFERDVRSLVRLPVESMVQDPATTFGGSVDTTVGATSAPT